MSFADVEATRLLLGAAHILVALAVSIHILLTKDDVRAAIGWTGLVWLAPILGSVLYALFGINRIRRQSGRVRRARALEESYTAEIAVARKGEELLPETTPAAVRPIATLVGAATGRGLTSRNAVTLLVDGDEAYPAMLDAIDRARRSVALATYIFDRGVVGRRFVAALERAVARGVEVRVLIDGVGVRYSRPPIVRELRAAGIPFALFLPPLLPVPSPYFNLRNHRKLLVIDGRVGFCGGMNIRDGCLLALRLPASTRDLHCRLEGPIVAHLMSTFAFDWQFTRGEHLGGEAWFPPLGPAGSVVARGIADGPDEDLETLLVTLLGAVSQAARSISLVTPYFLPDQPLVDALRVAALRGVRVDIVLPERSNLRMVQWAAMAQLAPVVRWGCRVHLSPPPFDHSKILVVDGAWSLLGSANWDPRSLRLNFEYAIECYSTELAAQLEGMVAKRIADGRRLTVADLQRRSIPVKLRDGVARLAQPYL